ncbi:hypothetical protein Tco_1561691 [Tanacetum coccineum]
MAQHVIPAAQLVPQYNPIGRCNNYAVLQSIPCSPECKIVGLILLDHCTEDMIKFLLDTEQFLYTVYMFRDTLQLPVETLENLFVAPANIHTIKAFMNRVGDQGVVDKTKINILQLFHAVINRTHVDYVALLCIPKRVDEDYHSIKDDVSLIRKTDDFKEYETVFMKVAVPMNQPQLVVSTQGTNRNTPKAHRSPTISAGPLETKKRKQTARESSSPRKIEPGSHKDNPEFVDDDDDKVEEKHSDDMGSLEIRNEETQTTILTPLSALRRMYKRQGYMIQDMERKCITTAKFWETHNKIDDILHEIVPQTAENEFNAHAPTIIEELFKNYVQSNVVHVHPTTTTSTKTKLFATLQYQLYLKMKRSLQDRADDIALWEALRRKFEMSSPSNTSCREDDFHSQHDEHQDDDAPPEGEKRVKRSKGSQSSKSARDEVIHEDETPELITEFQDVDKRVPTIFDRARMKATFRNSLSNQSRNAEEYAYHLEKSTNFMNPNEPSRYLYNKDLFFLKYGNTEERKYVLSLHKIHAEEFPEPDLEEKLNRWVRKEFKTFNKDARLSITHWKDSWNKRRVHDFQLGIESYQMKVNLTAPTITFSVNKDHAPYSILDEPQTSLIYLNSQDEKRVMYLVETIKFCDATLGKVLNEVKLRMFQSRMLKKPPLLSFLEFYKELEAKILGDGAQLMGLHFIQLELRLGKNPSRSFWPVKSAEILWQFWASSSFGVSLAHDGSWSKREPSL